MAQHKTAEIPDWVQADAACLRAWRSNKCWRRAARDAVPPGAAAREGGTTLGDTLLAAAQWWASRARREARGERREAKEAPQPLAPHTRRCPCRACEEKRAELLKRATTRREGRGRAFWVGHSCPEHREGWRISPERLSDFLATHDKTRDRKGKLCRVEMRPQWLAHLDSLVLDQALAELRATEPYWAWLVVRCVLDGHGQSAVARELGVHRATVCRHLHAALMSLSEKLLNQAPLDAVDCAEPAMVG